MPGGHAVHDESSLTVPLNEPAGHCKHCDRALLRYMPAGHEFDVNTQTASLVAEHEDAVV